MKIIIDRDFYSYFAGANKHDYHYFTNLLEAWDAYKRIRATDFHYSDAYQHTTIHIYRNDTITLKPQRPHARSAEAWRRIVWEREDALQRARLAVTGMDVLFMGSDGLLDDFEDSDLPFI